MDIKTVLALLIIGNVFTVILISAYQFQYRKEESVSLFIYGTLMEASAWILFGLRNLVTDVLSINIGNSLLFFGATLKIIAFLTVKDSCSKMIKRAYSVALALSISIFNLIVIFCNYENIRASVSSGVIVLLWIFPIYKLMSEKGSSILQRVIAVLYSAVLFVYVIRTYIGLSSTSEFGIYTHEFFNVLGFVSLYLVMIVGNIGFILLSKEKSDKQILTASMYDELTSILNRSAFQSKAKQTISMFSSKKEPLSLIIMDIDNFKAINDRFGHYCGDLVLKEFSALIRKHIRNNDIFGRFGGEEFTLLLPGTGRKQAEDEAERLRQIVEDSSISGMGDIKYTVSIGIVTLVPDISTKFEELYKASDDAMYRAKLNGKNRIETAAI